MQETATFGTRPVRRGEPTMRKPQFYHSTSWEPIRKEFDLFQQKPMFFLYSFITTSPNKLDETVLSFWTEARKGLRIWRVKVIVFGGECLESRLYFMKLFFYFLQYSTLVLRSFTILYLYYLGDTPLLPTIVNKNINTNKKR